MGSSRTRDWTCVSFIGRQILYCWVTREALIILIFKKFFIGGKLAPPLQIYFILIFSPPFSASSFVLSGLNLCVISSRSFSLTSQPEIGSPASCSCHMVVPSHIFITLFVTIWLPHKTKLWAGIKSTIIIVVCSTVQYVLCQEHNRHSTHMCWMNKGIIICFEVGFIKSIISTLKAKRGYFHFCISHQAE